MTARKVTVTLTEAQAVAIARLAECSANTWDDALGVLVDGQSVAAAYRGLEKLNAAIYRKETRP